MDSEARILIDARPGMTVPQFDAAARALAADYGVPATDIWDYLADIADQWSPTVAEYDYLSRLGHTIGGSRIA